MRLMLALVWVTITTATIIRYTPTKILLAKLEGATLDKKDTAPASTQYHEQDSGGFYSYGYSAGRSAKAEYLTLDGSSRGFYSYVDADGKLQTVKYEAGRNQGFKAAVTNLPKAPTNPNRVAPLPVRDTPEVQEAKKAHFEAYREAELRAALASQNEAARLEELSLEEPQRSERPQQEVADILESTRSKILAILSEGASAENNSNNLNGNAEEELNIDGAQNQEEEVENADEEDNSELLSIDSLQISQDGREANEEEGNSSDADNITIENGEEETEATAASRELSSAERQMTTYKLADLENSDDQADSRALYTFEGSGESSKDLLRLTELQHKSDLSLAQPKLTTIETVRVPVHSYYTVLAPRTKYTVVTPTTHQLVPREEALKRGHSLPISLSSSFLSHRLRSKCKKQKTTKKKIAMQFRLLYLSAILTLAAADGYYYETPAARTPLFWSASTPARQYQYHTQDNFGQYTYGYGEPLSTKQEVRTLDGITRGSYSYIDAAGKLQTVAYTADVDGFRVSATNLPKQLLSANAKVPLDAAQFVQETPEVAAARLQHSAAHRLAKLRLQQISTAATSIEMKPASDGIEKRVERLDILPKPVEDTPEVAAAKVEFFKRYEEVKQRNERLRQKQQQISGYTLVKSQPITVAVPLPNYKLSNVPSGVLRYEAVVPSNSREYLPITEFNL
ncbi:uncharacterized protein LOC128861756 [Anastrepha ludens]|uniref:uncharacterized protein LOC128861756 n=1 Tax=Anastrepha ludens TaxID=28586 RepID=UPI0023AEB0B8|nr:uncharacterized protein LOC128861756 [Anastrepha ludens]